MTLVTTAVGTMMTNVVVMSRVFMSTLLRSYSIPSPGTARTGGTGGTGGTGKGRGLSVP